MDEVFEWKSLKETTFAKEEQVPAPKAFIDDESYKLWQKGLPLKIIMTDPHGNHTVACVIPGMGKLAETKEG